jgi:hypothetical protein
MKDFYAMPQVRQGKLKKLKENILGICIISQLEKILPESKVLQIMFQTYNKDWDKVMWCLRMMASAVAGMPFQMMTYFFGSGGSGKDVIMGLCTALMGTGPRNYARSLKKTYFCVEPSPESPSPFLANTIGARWLIVNEVPNKQIIPETVKDLTDPRTTMVMARDLYAKAMGFYPFFRLIIMSNNQFPLKERDDAIDRRFSALIHTLAYKDVPTEAHHLVADPVIKRDVKSGKYVQELFALLVALVPTLREEVTGDMRIHPLPGDQETAMCDFADSPDDELSFGDLMEKYLKECPVDEAMPALKLREALVEPLKMKNEQVVNKFLRTKGIMKHKPNNKRGYLHHFERNGSFVYLKLKES